MDIIFQSDLYEKDCSIFLLFLICFFTPNNYEIINYKFKDKSFFLLKNIYKNFSLVEKYYGFAIYNCFNSLLREIFF